MEGLIVGAILGGLSILVAAPSSRKEIQKKISTIKNGNDEVIEVTKENTEKLIKKTKESIEDGFQKLSDIIKTNTQINEPDVITKK